MGTNLDDIRWLSPDGSAMSGSDWADPATRCSDVPVGRGIDDEDDEGRPLVDDDLLLLINASHLDVSFTIPTRRAGAVAGGLDTSDDDSDELRLREADPIGGSLDEVLSSSLPSRPQRRGRASAGRDLRCSSDLDSASRRLRRSSTTRALGVTDVYSSPLLEATRGSTHGYDVVDHSRLRSDSGRVPISTRGRELKQHGLGFCSTGFRTTWASPVGKSGWDDVLEMALLCFRRTLRHRLGPA